MKMIKFVAPLITLLGFLWVSAPAEAQLTYMDGDCFLGFRSTNSLDSINAYLVKVGSATQFDAGGDVTLDLGNISADLASIYGADWYTRNDILWAVAGCWYVDGGQPENTLYTTNPDFEPFTRDSSGSQADGANAIETMRFGYLFGAPTTNSEVATFQIFTNEEGIDNSYPCFQPGGWSSFGFSFRTWPSDEAIPSQAMYFNRIIPATIGQIGDPGDLIGHFALSADGVLTFTAGSGVIPTPTPTPTVTPTPSGSPTPTPSGSPTPTPSGSPTPTPSGSPTPTPSVTPPTSTLGNISTRTAVETGDNVLIGGFIITGNETKTVLVRAIGPSLPLPGALADPTLDLFNSSGQLIVSNDNWMDAPNRQAIIDTMIPPSNDLESAILMDLSPGAYTAIVRGANDTTGVALVEAYDLASAADSTLANISTRGLVQTADNVMIGGFIMLGTNAEQVLVRAIGPSLPLGGTLADPMLELHDANGALLASNDNWRDTQEADIAATGLPPSNDLESAIVETLAPNLYTAIVRGANGTTGVALIEIYNLGP